MDIFTSLSLSATVSWPTARHLDPEFVNISSSSIHVMFPVHLVSTRVTADMIFFYFKEF